ncbi:MAG TPA: hypothetical protein VMN38_12390 [Sphingomicrobium sp.]|nr:hypothetical protein [Sphingomicrobium sp.]
MHGISFAISAGLGSILLSACSEAPEGERERAATLPRETAQAGDHAPAPPVAPTEPAEGPTAGGDGSPIRLSPLSRQEIGAADLAGELGCGFERDPRETLLVAMGDVASKEPSFGVVKVGDSVESVSAPGGFDGMWKGAKFVGRGKTILVERTSSQPAGGGESPPYPARLTYQRADGASRSFDGTWTCGP